MRACVWFSFFGLPGSHYTKSLPYKSQSPTLYRVIEYDKEEIYNEIDRILAERGTQKFGIGQSLYYQLPLFCDPSSVIPEWCWTMLEDYHLSTTFNIPVARDLDSADAWKLDCFNMIENEINKCNIHQREKNG